MLRLSTKGRYGTRLMVQLALNRGDDPMLLKDIAERENLSLRYLEHLIPPLKTARLISSVRGAHGGYLLAKAPEDITVKQIIDALEGPLYPTECVSSPQICERSSECVTRKVWSELERTIAATLDRYTLQDLVEMKPPNSAGE